jgi:hypothetical protein
MKSKLQNENFSLKFLTPLFLIVCYWFYLNICFGYFLSKIFYNFFDSIKFRKKFSFKKIIKIIIDFFWKLIKNWFIRIGHKFLLLMDAIDRLILGVSLFLKKFKSLLKFQHNFRLMKKLLPIFWETFSVYCSLVSEILFLNNLINWVIQWTSLIRLLMTESVFITRIVYGLYLIILGIFGVLLGFLLGVYRREDEVNEVYVFLLLLLLKILYNNGFDDVLLEPLRIRSLEPRNIEEFSKFSFQVLEPSNSRPLKMILKEPDQRSQIPLPILSDPFISIDIDFIWEEPKNFKFELFKFYRNVNDKVKY